MLLFPKKLLTFLSVFILFSPIFAHAGFFSDFFSFLSGIEEERVIKETQAAEAAMPFLSSQTSSDQNEDDSVLFSVTQDSFLISPLNPLGTVSNSVNRDKITVYKVQEGDNPTSIAKSFGISLNTLLWANNLRNPNLIKVGDELVILPVSGVNYEIKKGDTIESIAKKFRADPAEISRFNGLAIGDVLNVGTELVIPDGELDSNPLNVPASTVQRFTSLPEYIGYYLRPILGGRNSRATRNNSHGLHGNNGVDLANFCGTPVMASADGTVIVARKNRFGYGNYVVINHPNGTQTLYGHLQNILASVGQSVNQGNIIGLLGRTGNSTGCHVHFEIRGARNPF